MTDNGQRWCGGVTMGTDGKLTADPAALVDTAALDLQDGAYAGMGVDDYATAAVQIALDVAHVRDIARDGWDALWRDVWRDGEPVGSRLLTYAAKDYGQAHKLAKRVQVAALATVHAKSRAQARKLAERTLRRAWAAGRAVDLWLTTYGKVVQTARTARAAGVDSLHGYQHLLHHGPYVDVVLDWRRGLRRLSAAGVDVTATVQHVKLQGVVP
jgi:hypothetical protein